MDWKKILGDQWTQEIEDLLKKGTENFVPQAVMNERITSKNEEIKNLNDQIKGYETKVGELTQKVGNSDELQKTIVDLKGKMESDRAENQKKIEDILKGNKVDGIITEKFHPKYRDLIRKEVNMDDIVVKGDEIVGLSPQIESLEKKYPELVAKQSGEGSGGGSAKKIEVDKNPWLKEHRNLTQQGKILKEDPELAKRLMAEAKIGGK